MTYVLAFVVGALVLGWLRHRRSVKDRRAGLDPTAPQVMRLLDDEPTGPAHRWQGSRGLP